MRVVFQEEKLRKIHSIFLEENKLPHIPLVFDNLRSGSSHIYQDKISLGTCKYEKHNTFYKLYFESLIYEATKQKATLHLQRVFALLHELSHHYDGAKNNAWYLKEAEEGMFKIFSNNVAYVFSPLESSANKRAASFLKFLNTYHKELLS